MRRKRGNRKKGILCLYRHNRKQKLFEAQSQPKDKSIFYSFVIALFYRIWKPGTEDSFIGDKSDIRRIGTMHIFCMFCAAFLFVFPLYQGIHFIIIIFMNTRKTTRSSVAWTAECSKCFEVSVRNEMRFFTFFLLLYFFDSFLNFNLGFYLFGVFLGSHSSVTRNGFSLRRLVRVKQKKLLFYELKCKNQKRTKQNFFFHSNRK